VRVEVSEREEKGGMGREERGRRTMSSVGTAKTSDRLASSWRKAW
jgi:hypothetical protein